MDDCLKANQALNKFLPEFSERLVANPVCLWKEKGIERLQAIFIPNDELERVYFQSEKWPAPTFEQVRKEIAWFGPRLKLFTSDKGLKAWMDKTLKNMGKRHTRDSLRNILFHDLQFQFYIKTQCLLLMGAGASPALIREVARIQYEARSDLASRHRLSYPNWVDMKKLMESLKRLLECAQAYLENETFITKGMPDRTIVEMDMGVHVNVLALNMLASAAILDYRHFSELEVLLVHHILTEMKPDNDLIGVGLVDTTQMKTSEAA